MIHHKCSSPYSHRWCIHCLTDFDYSYPWSLSLSIVNQKNIISFDLVNITLTNMKCYMLFWFLPLFRPDYQKSDISPHWHVFIFIQPHFSYLNFILLHVNVLFQKMEMIHLSWCSHLWHICQTTCVIPLSAALWTVPVQWGWLRTCPGEKTNWLETSLGHCPLTPQTLHQKKTLPYMEHSEDVRPLCSSAPGEHFCTRLNSPLFKRTETLRHLAGKRLL